MLDGPACNNCSLLVCECYKSMLDARILQLLRCFRRLQWQCDQPSWRPASQNAATARYVSLTASGVRAALATAFFALSVRLVPRVCRAAMKSGDRDLKRATRAYDLVWSCYLCYWARSKSASRARPVAVLMGTQRRDFANELCLSSTHYQRAAETGTSIEKTAR